MISGDWTKIGTTAAGLTGAQGDGALLIRESSRLTLASSLNYPQIRPWRRVLPEIQAAFDGGLPNVVA